MRTRTVRFLAFLLLICVLPTPARACYAVIVGSAASADGSEQRGWFQPSGGGAFNFREVYQTATRLGPDPRQFRGQQRITGPRTDWPPADPLPFAVTPRKKLAVADVAAVLRDNAGLVPLFQKSTQEAAVFQLRANLPPEIGCIYWRTTGRPDVSVLTPWYAGIQDTPQSCRPSLDVSTRLSLANHFQPPPGTFERDPRLAWWKFKSLEEYVDQDYAARIGRVREAWSAFEDREFQQQAASEAEILQLWPSKPKAARSRLTRYCAELAEESCRQADQLASDSRAKQGNNSQRKESSPHASAP